MSRNQHLSQALNAAMIRFDALPGASGSIVADAASSDLSGRSANFRLLRLLGLLLAAVLLWQAADLSSTLSAALARHQFIVPRGTLMGAFIACAFIGAWVAFFMHVRSTRANLLAQLTDAQRTSLEAVRELSKALPHDLPLLRENLDDVARRMIKIFPSRNQRLVDALAQLLLDTLRTDGFRELATEEAAVRPAIDRLSRSLAALAGSPQVEERRQAATRASTHVE